MKIDLEGFISSSAQIEQVLEGMEDTSEVRQLREKVADLKNQLLAAYSQLALVSTDSGSDYTEIEFKNVTYPFLCKNYEPSTLRNMRTIDRLKTCEGLINWCNNHGQKPLQHWVDVVANNGQQ